MGGPVSWTAPTGGCSARRSSRGARPRLGGRAAAGTCPLPTTAPPGQRRRRYRRSDLVDTMSRSGSADAKSLSTSFERSGRLGGALPHVTEVSEGAHLGVHDLGVHAVGLHVCEPLEPAVIAGPGEGGGGCGWVDLVTRAPLSAGTIMVIGPAMPRDGSKHVQPVEAAGRGRRTGSPQAGSGGIGTYAQPFRAQRPPCPVPGMRWGPRRDGDQAMTLAGLTAPVLTSSSLRLGRGGVPCQVVRSRGEIATRRADR